MYLAKSAPMKTTLKRDAGIRSTHVVADEMSPHWAGTDQKIFVRPIPQFYLKVFLQSLRDTQTCLFCENRTEDRHKAIRWTINSAAHKTGRFGLIVFHFLLLSSNWNILIPVEVTARKISEYNTYFHAFHFSNDRNAEGIPKASVI